MKTISRKKIILFKIKNVNSSFYKLLFLNNNDKNNSIFFLFGLYFKVFFDVGMNIFGTIPFWFSKIVNYVCMREFAFFKVFSINAKSFKIFKNYSTFFSSLISKSKQGYFLEFKIIGYFRAKRTCLLRKKKSISSKKKIVVMYLGYSHVIFISTSNTVLFMRGKKRFMFFTPYKQEFIKIIKQIFYYKPFNVYKIKGLRTSFNLKKMKPGKQKQQKKVIKK